MKCVKGNEISVHKTPAGYYIGCFDDEGPVCRISRYYNKEEQAKQALDNGTFYPDEGCVLCPGVLNCVSDEDEVDDSIWSVNCYQSAKYDDDMRYIVDKCWWYASITYEDGMIIVGGDGITAHDAIVAAVNKLTWKAKKSFCMWAHENKELLPFYWIHESMFCTLGKVYSIDNANGKVFIRSIDGNRVRLEDIEFMPVKQSRTPYRSRVKERIDKLQEELDYQEELIEHLEDDALGGY